MTIEDSRLAPASSETGDVQLASGDSYASRADAAQDIFGTALQHHVQFAGNGMQVLRADPVGGGHDSTLMAREGSQAAIERCIAKAISSTIGCTTDDELTLLGMPESWEQGGPGQAAYTPTLLEANEDGQSRLSEVTCNSMGLYGMDGHISEADMPVASSGKESKDLHATAGYTSSLLECQPSGASCAVGAEVSLRRSCCEASLGCAGRSGCGAGGGRRVSRGIRARASTHAFARLGT